MLQLRRLARDEQLSRLKGIFFIRNAKILHKEHIKSFEEHSKDDERESIELEAF